MHITQRRLKSFAIAHDSLPAFHAGYLAVTVLIAALLNVGAFALLIAAHAALDFVKYREVHGRPWHQTLLSTLRESLLDLFLLFGALVLAVYLHHGSSLIALSGLARAEASFFRGIILLAPRVEILWNGVWIFSNFKQHLFVSPEASGPWKRSERLSVVGVAISLLLIVLSFQFFDTEGVIKILDNQLVPWRI